MKVLVAPDKFKDALSAAQAAAAIAAGIRQSRPDADVDECPLADGGEGAGPILARAAGAVEQRLTVLDALGRPVCARWWHEPQRHLAILEMAEAAGLWRIPPGERRAWSATSFGVGQLMRAALERACREIWLCVGGSASVDGGAGCLQALGWRLFDSFGSAFESPCTGGMLAQVARVEPAVWPAGVTVTVLCDVTNPLLGPAGAAPGFAAQKGATADQVRKLEDGLTHWAARLRDATGRDVSQLPGGGAAGGLPAGLAAAGCAELRSGFEQIAHTVELGTRLAGAALCITGEGRLDAQTQRGKVVSGVARMAQAAGVPVIALVGAAAEPSTIPTQKRALGLADVLVVTPAGTPLAQALAETAENLRRAARHLAGRLR